MFKGKGKPQAGTGYVPSPRGSGDRSGPRASSLDFLEMLVGPKEVPKVAPNDPELVTMLQGTSAGKPSELSESDVFEVARRALTAERQAAALSGELTVAKRTITNQIAVTNAIINDSKKRTEAVSNTSGSIPHQLELQPIGQQALEAILLAEEEVSPRVEDRKIPAVSEACLPPQDPCTQTALSEEDVYALFHRAGGAEQQVSILSRELSGAKQTIKTRETLISAMMADASKVVPQGGQRMRR